MKRSLKLIISVLMIFAHTSLLSAQSQDTQTALSNTNAEVSIKFYNRTMYYPGEAQDNPVYVHVTVKNSGTEQYRFMIAEDKMFSVDFTAFNVKNTKLPQTEKLIRTRTTNQTVYYREVSLQCGEEYSFVVNLKDYLNISDPSIYYIELSFYPDLYRNRNTVINSNRLSLEIHPSPAAASSTVLAVEADTSSLLEREDISPDKVVEQTIIARQKSLWDQYFLYMDLEEMLKRDPSRSRRFNMSSSDERADLLRSYRTDLMQQRIDNDIVALPAKFKIETTTYSLTEGTVTVIEYFNNDTFTEKKRYTYYVRQRDGIWMIYDYTVDNLGTE